MAWRGSFAGPRRGLLIGVIGERSADVSAGAGCAGPGGRACGTGAGGIYFCAGLEFIDSVGDDGFAGLEAVVDGGDILTINEGIFAGFDLADFDGVVWFDNV